MLPATVLVTGAVGAKDISAMETLGVPLPAALEVTLTQGGPPITLTPFSFLSRSAKLGAYTVGKHSF
jgi:hypothetical protein